MDTALGSSDRPASVRFEYCTVQNRTEKYECTHSAWWCYGSDLLSRWRRKDQASKLDWPRSASDTLTVLRRHYVRFELVFYEYLIQFVWIWSKIKTADRMRRARTNRNYHQLFPEQPTGENSKWKRLLFAFNRKPTLRWITKIFSVDKLWFGKGDQKLNTTELYSKVESQ